ncbi:unnamed protein product [Mytilus edulis]|uniref:DNA-directed DNA polymerase n=1 Tax=Mytilus edulis TaxID=6550 RepID=A0A8S3Q207_MYTED|nr:unnamed protein product [Mytilus edulis]
MHKKEHKCGEIDCKTCKDYFESGHLCFMMPIQDEKLSSIADVDTSLKRNTQDEHSNQVYIFFDIECTQDDLFQCEQGYDRSGDSLKCKNCRKSRCGVQENQAVVLEHLPDIKYYNPNGMKVDDRKLFLEWYATNAHNKFDFKLELLKNCQSDVDILRRCCIKYRRLFMNMTTIDSNKDGIDPFEKCITIASACNLVFRKNFRRPETIGIIPAQGYNPEEKHSIKALKWLRYVSKSKGMHIQHARNGGEKNIGDYRVDGYHKNDNGEEIVFEYHGCFWHGCSNCYSKQTVNRVNYVTPLEPRNAFSGGRTEAFKLYHEAKDGEQIKYYDVTSLYPFINKTGKAVLGHPSIITENFGDISNYDHGLV